LFLHNECKSNIIVEMEKCNVLYIVNADTPMAIALEVAGKISRLPSINLKTVLFQEENKQTSKYVDVSVCSIGTKSFFDLRGIKNLWQLTAQFQPEVVHVHHTASSFWGAILAKLVVGAAVVRTEHNNQRHYSIPQNIIHWCSQVLADRVLCNSEDTYRNLYPLQKCVIGDRWEVIYNGVNVSRIRDASSREFPLPAHILEDRFVVGSVGRLIDQKNYQRLIRAFPLVLDEIPEAHLVLIGSGKNRSELEEEAIAQDVEHHVTFAGKLVREDVYAVLHRFDLFVMPSLWEGFCNAVVEAMAAGLPVVCSDISTLREVVGDVGHYADPENPEAIARSIVQVIRKGPEDWKREGESARSRATKKYSIEKTAKSYIEVYKQVGKKL